MRWPSAAPVAFISGWRRGCVAAWLQGCLAARLPGCLAARLPGCLAAWLPGRLAARMPGYMASLQSAPPPSLVLEGRLEGLLPFLADPRPRVMKIKRDARQALSSLMDMLCLNSLLRSPDSGLILHEILPDN